MDDGYSQAIASHMTMREIPVLGLGSVVRELLALERGASVIGIASRGVYLLLDCNWAIYLSYESYRGPLTLNISKRERNDLAVQHNTSAIANSKSIFFPSLNLSLSINQAPTWQAPALPGVVLTPDQRKRTCLDMADKLLVSGKASIYCSALTALMRSEKPVAEGDLTMIQMANIRDSFQKGNATATAEALLGFCGRGEGLTPGGDDLIAGFALALNRWTHALFPTFDVDVFNREIINAVYRQTTTLSANLIECATRGQADERVLYALDGIISGEPVVDVCAGYLAGWGHSSGLDALAGMALAL